MPKVPNARGAPPPTVSSSSSSQSSAGPPPHFPSSIQYLTQPVPSKHLSTSHRLTYCSPSLLAPPNALPKLSIKPISTPSHPAFGQCGLFALQKLPPRSWIRDYLGVVHTEVDVDPTSDYDLCLARIPSSTSKDGYEIVGIDATRAGNEARFVNDYRGVLERPNAIFELRNWDLGAGKGEGVRMAVWAGPKGVDKGSEICVSYGRGFWDGRKGSIREEQEGG